MRAQRGNVLFYILLAVVLFSALTIVVANMMRAGGDMGAGERAKLSAQALLDYAGKAKITVQDMKLNGTAATSLVFLRPGDAGYSTAPHTGKVFHPEAGGLPMLNLTGIIETSSMTPAAGIYMVRNTITDVGGASAEVILSVRGIQKAVCEKINEALVGSTSISSTGGVTHNSLFVTGGTLIDGAGCAACVGKTALCVAQGGGTVLYTFYSAVDPN